MKTSHLLPRDLFDIIFRGFLRLCWSARPAAFARIREQLGLTQNDLATTLDATRITISGWENGRFLPNETNVERYHNALLDKAKLDGKLESWLIDTIFAEIPELYEAIPKTCKPFDGPILTNEEMREVFFKGEMTDSNDNDDEDNEAKKSYLSGVV